MAVDPIDFATRFFKGQDERKGMLVPELCAPDYRASIVGFPTTDAAGHDAFGGAFYAGFPDIYHTIDEARATDDGIAVRFTLRGTHTGSFMGIPSTGNAVTVPAMVLLSIADGQVTELRAMFDRLGMMQQIGVIPS
ncbi:MAG TPA: ester cyclase [Candidatus Kapabacteria bacterium]|nr:ester cyclase [Candidatus Kapabacteria bacterium]